MKIVFNSLKLSAFKDHRDLHVSFGEVTRISGKNGAGKSSIGEAITWILFGTDTLGSKADPSPTTYAFESVEAQLLLTVDDKQLLLGRTLPAGKASKFYVNEVPKKAKEFEDVVSQLFDKQLFMSLFNPSYFFSQHWEDQRAQLLRYVLPPSNKEVIAQLPAPQADKLSGLVKQKSLNDLQAQHAENKRKQDKALIAAKSKTKTLEEQLRSMPDIESIDVSELTTKLQEIGKQEARIKESQGEARAHNARVDKLRTQLQVAYSAANNVRADFSKLKDTAIEDTCAACGQTLNEEATATANEHKMKQLDGMRTRYNQLSEQYNRMKQELAEMQVVNIDLDELSDLAHQRHEIDSKLQDAGRADRLALAIEEAKQDEKDVHESYTESVFILDAIKAFRAKEAELMAEKVSSLFERLTLKLFQENKGDGEQKPFFEVEMDSKPYRKLSVGEKIEAGLELRNVLVKQSGIITPCLVDNAESYTSAINAIGQIIVCKAVEGQSFLIEKVGE